MDPSFFAAYSLQVIVQSGLFPAIVLRVLKHRDPLLCKVPTLLLRAVFPSQCRGDTARRLTFGRAGTNVRASTE